MQSNNSTKSICAKRIGELHVLQHTPCQDYVSSKVTGDVSTLALSDGAGSCQNSQLAAEHAVNWALDYCVENFDYIYNATSNAEDRKEIAKDGNEIFDNFVLPKNECCCTLLAVAIRDDKWIAMHIGDGIIFKMTDDIEILSLPDNGQYANETFFLNEEQASEHLRVYSGKNNGKIGFLMTSDGCEDALYDRSNKKIATAVSKMIDWLFNHEETVVLNAIQRELEDNFSYKSDDDLSIGIITRGVENV